MKIAVVGSRGITDYEYVKDMLMQALVDQGLKHDTCVIISGGAKGVDTLAKKFAEETKTDFVLFKPYHLIDNKEPYRPRFFFSRNKQIADNADVVLIFWDGKSSGTAHMVNYCKHKKKQHYIYYPFENALAVTTVMKN